MNNYEEIKSKRNTTTGLKVLIVDDLKVNRVLARIIFEMTNFEIYEAKNGAEAIEIYKTLKPDVVLMDICMPEVDGIRAMEKIRRDNEGGKKVPIIAFTSGEHTESKMELIKRGFSEYLKKPFHENDLYDKISLFFSLTDTKMSQEGVNYSFAKF